MPALRLIPVLLLYCAAAHTQTPAWCRALPRPEFQKLERRPVDDSWFEVYAVAPGVFAIYEPHQSEETISYLITGDRQALQFDTGMGIGDLRRVTAELTKLPIVVLNSHTHFDHVGSNWQFPVVFALDTAFTRRSAAGSREDAQADIGPGEICGDLPKGFDPKTYQTRAWNIQQFRRDGDRIDLGGRTLEIIATPGHTPDALCLLDRAHGLLFTGDTYYKGGIWLFRPETDLNAYSASVRRLATLARQVEVVLGAHNVPVMPASVLPKLADAFAAVRSGKVSGTKGRMGVRYQVDDISFVLRQ